jgi:hypothetical protein
MERFRPQFPGDEEWLEGMRCLYGSGEEGHVLDFEGAREHFMNGVRQGNLLCVRQMATFCEGDIDDPQCFDEGREWRARAMALERKEPDWMDWTWERTVLQFGDYSQIRQFYEELAKGFQK